MGSIASLIACSLIKAPSSTTRWVKLKPLILSNRSALRNNNVDPFINVIDKSALFLCEINPCAALVNSWNTFLL